MRVLFKYYIILLNMCSFLPASPPPPQNAAGAHIWRIIRRELKL